MRVDNLLGVRRRKFVLTTDSKHGLPIQVPSAPQIFDHDAAASAETLASNFSFSRVGSLYGAGGLREDVVRMRANQSNRTDHKHQNDGKHHRVFRNILAIIVSPKTEQCCESSVCHFTYLR